MTDRDCRVVRDDGKAFVSLEAAGAATYGRLRCGAGIARAIRTGGKAGGHRWRYALGCEPREEGPEALPGRTIDAIEAMARKMGLRPKPRRGAWTRAEESVLLRGLMDMARETGRTPGAIVTRLGHLRSAAKQGERGVR